MLEIICAGAIMYGVHRFCEAAKTVAKDYNEKINNGWIDCRSI